VVFRSSWTNKFHIGLRGDRHCKHGIGIDVANQVGIGVLIGIELDHLLPKIPVWLIANLNHSWRIFHSHPKWETTIQWWMCDHNRSEVSAEFFNRLEAIPQPLIILRVGLDEYVARSRVCGLNGLRAARWLCESLFRVGHFRRCRSS